ncbi:MAG: antibiotic biosynthesis monooxygenase [bacterium]|nr:antibiotic biosynthesis monooxygenase [bacterium]
MRQLTAANTPDPPYYAVIFTNQRTELDDDGYNKTAETIARLASDQPGYLGIESVRNPDGFGVTISYWKSLEDIKNWKANSTHQSVQKKGQEKWYDHYTVRVCKVEKQYSFHRSPDR